MTSPTVFPQVVLSNQAGVPYDATAPLPVTGTLSANSTATATAAAPSYVEAAADPLSQTLAGDLRTIAKQSGTWTVTGTGGTFPVTGTFWQATQPVSIASMPSTPVTGTFWQTTQPVSLASVPSHAITNAGTFAVQATEADGGNVAIGATTDAVVAAGALGSLSAKLRAISRDLVANIVLAAGSAIIGKVGIDQTTAGTTNGVVGNATSAAGGIPTTARLASSAASTNATNVKTTAGRVYSVQAINKAAYDVFLVLYDSATNPPVPGTTAIRKKIAIPAGSAVWGDWPLGMSFASGIGYAFTKLAADADTTAIAAADVLQLNIDYA